MISSETRAQRRTGPLGILELCGPQVIWGRFEQNMIRAESGEVAFDSTSSLMKCSFPVRKASHLGPWSGGPDRISGPWMLQAPARVPRALRSGVAR